ncbi:hypothetical protein ACFE04_015635 [Oxalis oulophora]
MACSKVLAICLCFLTLIVTTTLATHVSHDGRAITINGQRRVLLSGSIHYPRSTAEMWPDLIKKAKEGGLDAIETYVFWNSHEPSRRQYDFTGDLDLMKFLKTIQDAGLYAVLRIGPYVCAEWNYGGFPMWLHNMPGIEFRTANTVFMNEMQNFTSLIVNMAKENNLFASQGGPIILAQIENEYGNVISSYGDAGKAYVEWFKNWGGQDPRRTAEDLAYSVAKFFQSGGTFQNYYMYHGGTNFGRTAGGPYITTTYDYDAPLDEFGNLNQPKWEHLKQLHDALHSIEKPLTHGNISSIDLGNSVTVTKYETEEVTTCFVDNSNTTTDAQVKLYNGVELTVAAWSVSILPDCKTEAYNTAKVNVQTSVMVKKVNAAEDEPSSLKWGWRPENIDSNIIQGKGDVSANGLIDQKSAADDTSDYLWYMTRVDLSENDPIWSDNMRLRIHGSGHVFHVYVNGNHLGSQWEKYGISDDVFEKRITLNPGKNLITILSATVGFQNYGPNFDLTHSGIVGPVEIIGIKDDEKIIKDLSSHKWSYRVGLQGFDKNVFNGTAKWLVNDMPTGRMMTWYKTTFKAPLGKDPVVLDLEGMGKGVAWVNGRSIGRYWPSYIARDGCSLEACDYRGPYSNSKCITNCGKPTQKWYHVPRSYVEEGENTLVLFEEFGGNPSEINFQTVTIGTACANAYEGHSLELSCQNRPISDIKFASFGNPTGTCGSFVKGTCEAQNDILSIIHNDCVGKESCSIEISEEKFGSTNCGADAVKRLAVEAVC